MLGYIYIRRRFSHIKSRSALAEFETPEIYILSEIIDAYARTRDCWCYRALTSRPKFDYVRSFDSKRREYNEIYFYGCLVGAKNKKLYRNQNRSVPHRVGKTIDVIVRMALLYYHFICAT